MQKGENKDYIFDKDFLINHVPGGIAIYRLADPLEILYFNDGVCALSGHTREEYLEIVGSDAMNIVYEEDCLPLKDEIEAAVSEKRRVDFTYRIRHKDRGSVWVHLSAINIQKADEDLIYYAIFMDISDERKTHKILRDIAEHDSLTGAFNRIGFERKIKEYLLKNEAALSAFIMLDIDNFKQVNDFLGHTKGDGLLCRISDLLKDVFGTKSFVGRIGGDEFAVFVTAAVSEKELTELLERFHRISGAEYNYQDSEVCMSCSMGVALFPRDGYNFAHLYANADRALIYAKNTGKNQYQFFGRYM